MSGVEDIAQDRRSTLAFTQCECGKGQERTLESEGSELSSIPIFATRYI